MFEGNIVIEKRILHIIKKEAGKESLSLSEFEIDKDDKIDSLINKYLNASQRDSKRNFGEFNITNKDKSVIKSVISIFNNSENFINQTKEITRLLKEAMKGTNAKSTNILFVKYKQKELDTIAIIKLNFNDNFVPKEKDEHGKKKIAIEVNSLGFNENQKIEKIAIIQLKDGVGLPIKVLEEKKLDEIDISEYLKTLVLDKQSAETSLYWRNFLDCTIDDNGKNNTNSMTGFLLKQISEIYKDEPKQILMKNSILAAELQKGGEFNISNTLNLLFKKEDIEKVNANINEKGVNTSFEINEDVVGKRFDSDTWYVSNKIMIRGNSQDLNREIEILDTEYDDGRMDIVLRGVSKG